MKLSDYVIGRIAKEVDHIFMLAGGGCMHLVDSVGRCNEIEYICNLHEQAGAIAADAYGQYTNNLGVALVTAGPGGTNAITGVAAAWIDSTPCLFISGQVKSPDLMTGRNVRQMGFQEVDIVNIVKPITKYAITILDPNSIRYHLDKAIYLAKSGRPGPVWIDIPLDVQAASINPSKLTKFNYKEAKKLTDKSELKEKVSETIRLFNQAERPVILAGNGVRLGKAYDDFLKIIEILQVPVLTTWKAIDFLHDGHPLYMGRPGATGQRYANFTQQNADWILVLGARLDLGQTGYNHKWFAREAKKIVVDVDASEINKLDMDINVAACFNVKEFISEFLRQRFNLVLKDISNWWEHCRKWKEKYPIMLPEYSKSRKGINNYALIDVLSSEISPSDVLIPGSSGACSEITLQSFRVREGVRILNSPGLGAMGFGVPASIGGCIASGKKRTICIDGDGGFQMNSQDLETVKRLNLPIKFFVLNNGGYGSIMATQNAYFSGRFVGSNPESCLTLPDSVMLAKAYGIRTVKINTQKCLRKRVKEVLNLPGPIVCDVLIAPNQVTAPRLSSMQKPDGSIVSCPMEDLWPFLKREEFFSNMLITPVDQ